MRRGGGVSWRRDFDLVDADGESPHTAVPYPKVELQTLNKSILFTSSIIH